MKTQVNCDNCGKELYTMQHQPGADGEMLNFVSRDPDDYTPEGMPIYRCECGAEKRPGVKVPGSAPRR